MSSSSSKVATYIPNYWNPAGPGDYNIPAYSETAAYRNSPGYSMGPRTKVPYFKGFEVVSDLEMVDKSFQEFQGKATPGSGVYKPDHKYVRMSLP